MKKYIYLIVLALILGLVLTGCLLSNVGQVPTNEQSGIAYLTKHTEGDPFTTDLIAGGGNPASAIDVGNVLVWNDEINLYVKYVITDPDWCLTETHLHVFLDNDEYTDITLKNGNPPPGQFDYKTKHDCVTEYIYEIPVEWEPGMNLYIAAHAVVLKLTGDPYADEVVAFNRVNGIEYNTSGDNGDNGNDALGPPRGESGCVIQSGDPSGCWTSPGYIPGLWNGTTFVPDTFNDLDDTYCLDCNIEGCCPEAGFLTVAFTDNICRFAANPADASLYIYEVGGKTEGFLVEVLDEDGNVVASYVSSAQEEFNEAIPIYLEGTGTFSRVRLTPTDNGGGDPVAPNTSGPDFDAVECLCPVYEEETAWAAGLGFPGKNWATYFTYTVQGWNWVEEINVLADGTIVSSVALDSGGTYKLVADGIYRFANWGEAGIADAKYSLRPPGQWYSYHSETGNTWVSGADLPAPWTHYLEVWGGGPLVPLDWDWDGGGFNSDHSYTVCVTGDGSTMQFRILDNAYGDNSGFLTVTIYKWE